MLGNPRLPLCTPHNFLLHLSRLMCSSTLIDELGYLPIDKYGADLLFQIISQRYERAPMVITNTGSSVRCLPSAA